jgi:hypothetical protein
MIPTPDERLTELQRAVGVISLEAPDDPTHHLPVPRPRPAAAQVSSIPG